MVVLIWVKLSTPSPKAVAKAASLGIKNVTLGCFKVFSIPSYWDSSCNWETND